MNTGKHTYRPKVTLPIPFGVEKKSRRKSKVVPIQGVIIVLLSVSLYLLTMGAAVTLTKLIMG